MATTPTQNPVPSEAVVDLKFNAGKIDEFVTSFFLKYTDRLGRDHLTIEGMRDIIERAIRAFGFITMDSFEDGATIDNSSQVLRWKSNGEYYRWDGSFPKAVTANSTPESSGGIGIGKWVSVGDAALRGQITGGEGDTFVGSSYGGNIFADYSPSQYRKLKSFADGGVVISSREATLFTDGFWYIYTGDTFPQSIPSAPDSLWANVGLLNTSPVNDATNFGFINNMVEATPVISAMMKSPFYEMTFPPNSTINIATRWNYRSKLIMDGRGSTIVWKGAIVNSSNKANKRDNAVIWNGPNLPKQFVSFKNFNIKTNDWGVGINLETTRHFSLSDIYVDGAQCAGINVANCQMGNIDRIELNNCAARTDQGFTNDDLEAWSDGMIVWYGSTEITINNVIITSDGTRAGRCGFVVDGYIPPGGITPTGITASNLRVYGYDRPVHTELTGRVTVNTSTFEYNSSNKHDLLHSCVVVWNVLDTTVFNNCTFRSDRQMMKISGANAVFNECKMLKVDSTTPFFRSGVETAGDITFNNCNLYQSGNSWGMSNANFTFNNCKIGSDAESAMDFSASTGFPKSLLINDCEITRCHIQSIYAPRFSVVKISESTISSGEVECFTGGIANVYWYNTTANKQISATSVLYIMGPEPKLGTTPPSGAEFNINGDWIAGVRPVGGRPDGSGDWNKGARVRNLNAGASETIGWACITAGTPGTWASLGTLGGPV
ncbi:hypothetical protein AB9H26_14200 [Yersinia enterocolitica]|uniref:tail fiber/spike domain-containing protein n=1 Tax=Yersinia enterocolitica TaxID=630 RepID=UPI003D0244B6